MNRRIFTSLAATTAVAASILISSGAAEAAPDTATAASTADARGGGATANTSVPTPIRVTDPALKIVATMHGAGKQVYVCGSDGKYALREPVAVLSSRGGTAGIHGKGPYWASFDGSKVTGAAGPVQDKTLSGDTNVPWLLVTAASTEGETGVFSKVKFIQRLDTRGGVAPSSCTAPSTIARDYSANYVFWA
jgi:hypothetical protein